MAQLGGGSQTHKHGEVGGSLYKHKHMAQLGGGSQTHKHSEVGGASINTQTWGGGRLYKYKHGEVGGASTNTNVAKLGVRLYKHTNIRHSWRALQTQTYGIVWDLQTHKAYNLTTMAAISLTSDVLVVLLVVPVHHEVPVAVGLMVGVGVGMPVGVGVAMIGSVIVSVIVSFSELP